VLRARWTTFLAVAGAVAVLVVLREGHTYTLQVNNFIRAYATFLETQEYRKRTGTLPTTVGVTDVWGRAFRYETDGQNVLIVGFGSDGVPDDPSYSIVSYATTSDVPRRTACWDRTRDTVLFNAHLVQGCAK
jgi:hypothetical protein